MKVAGVLLGILILIPAGYVGFLYATYVDETIVTGSAYGFTIGQSKREAYMAAGREFRRGTIVGINTVHDREEELRAQPWLGDHLTIPQAQERFAGWDLWEIWLYKGDDRPTLPVLVVFEGDELSAVGPPGLLGSTWHPPELPFLQIVHGQARDEVFASIEALSRSPGYQGLRLSTGWMARRQPRAFAPDEFRLVEAAEDWTLLVDHRWSYFNTVRLRFIDYKLSEIHRHRQYFELP